MQEDVDSQTAHREHIGKEVAEIDETLEALKETCDNLNEQLLKVDLKMSQVVSEKLRLELELQKYRKLGKQPKPQA